MAENSSIEWTEATWNPADRVYEDQPRLQALLCRKDVPTPQSNGAKELPQRFPAHTS